MDDSTGAGAGRVTAPVSNSDAAKEVPNEPRTDDQRPSADPASARAVRVGKKHELTDEDLREIIKTVGRPWLHRRKFIPLWKIKALRNRGFSLRQVGVLYSVSPSTVKRRLRGE